MNISTICVLATILTMFTAGIISNASAAGFTITMETDEAVYDHASIITVMGHVEPIDPNGSDVTIVVRGQIQLVLLELLKLRWIVLVTFLQRLILQLL